MDSSTCVISVSEGNSYGFYARTRGREKSYMENKQFSAGVKEIAAVNSEDVGVPITSKSDSYTVQFTGDLSEALKQISVPNSSCEQTNADICDALIMCESSNSSLSSDLKGQRSFSKSATFPSSRETCLLQRNASGQDKITEAEASGYSRSISLPQTSTNLVSAMKGSRAQSGASPISEPRVKWAPEVYDPPCTSMSHTVNGHRHRPKAKKKDSRKNKHKGKAARGSSSESRSQMRRFC